MIEGIDWDKQKNSVVKRVFERAIFTEKKEFANFYWHVAIKKIRTAEKINNSGSTKLEYSNRFTGIHLFLKLQKVKF